MSQHFVDTRAGRLEYAWHGAPAEAAPTIVFLHEGLGSLSLWRDVPQVIAGATGCGSLVYSRAGYGRSAPAPLPWSVRFMHDEATVLGDVLRGVGVRQAILFGHSDGASISIIHAGGTPAVPLLGLVLEAPHVFTEQSGLDSIAAIRERYATTDLRERMRKHHFDNVDVAFRGWNDVWLHPDFVRWNIEEYLPGISVPVLVLQGEDDEYGTWRQVEAVERQAGAPVQSVRLPACGHSPHRDQRDRVVAETATFVARVLSAVQRPASHDSSHSARAGS